MAAPPGELGKRLVFLSVRGRDTTGLPRTRGKRVLGVGDDATWDTFLATVASRLSLRGVKAVYHASTGAVMRSLDELQDIEDLEVEELDDAGGDAGGSAAGFSSPAPGVQAQRKALSVAVSLSDAQSQGDGEEDKYARRVSLPTRLLQQLMPSWSGSTRGSASAGDGSSRTPGPKGHSREVDSLGEPHGSTARRRKLQRRQPWRRLLDPPFALMAIALISSLGTLLLLKWKFGRRR